jgi:hypothetical protein
MNLNETIRKLGYLERSYMKEKYTGDATKYAFMRHSLILLREIAKTRKRKPSAYQLKVGKYMKQGKSLKEAHKLAKG